jgi:hypothetical protein
MESCHSTWIFDEDRMRFRRILKFIEVGQHAVTTAWRPYHRLQIDLRTDTFTILLNAEGTRMIRSWRHDEHCTQCGGHETSQLSLDDIRSAVSS